MHFSKLLTFKTFRKYITHLLVCVFYMRARIVLERAEGLHLICCLRNTIAFLLSDRVSRRTRDRARQCALEEGHPNHPPHLQAHTHIHTEPFTTPSANTTSSRQQPCRGTLCRLHFCYTLGPRKLRARGGEKKDPRLDYI